MAEHHASNYSAPTVEVALSPLRKWAMTAAVVGLGAWLVLGFINLGSYASSTGGEPEHGGTRDFFLTYLAGYIFWVSIPIGAMTLSWLAWLTSASWGLVLRRCFQAATRTWPVLILLSLPVIASLFMKEESPFWWVVPAAEIVEFKKEASDAFIHEQAHRQAIYLNTTGFLIRTVIIFGIYMFMSRCLNNWAVKSEDDGCKESFSKLRIWSGPSVLLWALTWTVFITDLAMSIEVSWASTMFPVVSAMNSFLCAMAFSSLVFYTLVHKNEPVLSIIKDKFRIDIGSLTYGFTMVWSYATFCQYMLIWAGNLPEEIGHILKRTNGGWEYMAYALLVVHWFLPFVLFLFRGNKTDPTKMMRLCVMLLLICATDVIWWIVPAYSHPHQVLHLPMAIAAIAGVGGVWSLSFLNELSKRNLLPKKDTEFLATWGHHH